MQRRPHGGRPAVAQTTITTSTTGPIYGNDNSIDVTSSGGIFNSPAGVISTGTNTTTVLTNSGSIAAFSIGVLNEATGSFNSITNSGWISGNKGLSTSGTIGTFENQAGASLVGDIYGYGFLADGVGVGSLQNAGSITGYNAVVIANATLGAFTNSGTTGSSGGYGFGLQGTGSVGTITNSGLIDGGSGVDLAAGTSVLTLANSGTISGANAVVLATSGTVTNAAGGLINATGVDGVYVRSVGSLAGLVNAGSISGVRNGFNGEDGSTVGTLTNSGTISGEYYGAFLGTTGTVTNAAGGLIRSNTAAGFGIQADSATPIAIINAGTISGANGGVRMISSGTFTNQAGGVAEGVAARVGPDS